MVDSKKTRNLIREEFGEKSNRYTFKALSAVMTIILLILVLNEIGVFEMAKKIVRVTTLTCFAVYLILFLITRNKNSYRDERLKYLIILSIVIMTFALSIFLNVPATLALLLPLMFSTQYRSVTLCNLTVFFSVICAAFSPILAFQTDSYSLGYLAGFIEATTGKAIVGYTATSMSHFDQIKDILLYLSFPQVLIITAYGVIAHSITMNNISSIQASIKVADLNSEVEKHLEREVFVQESIVNSLTNIIESRDSSTGNHVSRTKKIVELIISEMLKDPKSGVDERRGQLIIEASPLHDIGKITVSDTILCKPGELSVEEREIIKTHTIKSEEIIERVFSGIEDEDLIAVAKRIGRSHHERFDGTGYPDGLKGEEIPLEARIMTIADVYDALVSRRYYKHPFTKKKALEEMVRGSGSQFDDKLLKYFIEALPEVEKIYK